MRPYEKFRQQNVVGKKKKNNVVNDDNRINEHIAKLQAKFHGKTEEVKKQGTEEKQAVRPQKKEKKGGF